VRLIVVGDVKSPGKRSLRVKCQIVRIAEEV